METELENTTEIRSIKEADVAFIFSTWLRGLYYGNSWFKEIPKDIFMESYHRVVEQILARPDVQGRVCCLKEDQDTILGYAVLEPKRSAIHWLYVKDAWRRFGIAKALVPASGTWVVATHLTDETKKFKPREIKFNPFLT